MINDAGSPNWEGGMEAVPGQVPLPIHYKMRYPFKRDAAKKT